MSHLSRLGCFLFGTIAVWSLPGCASDPPTTVLQSTGPIDMPPAPAGSPVALHGQLQVVGTQLLDQSGAPIQLKGVSSDWLSGEVTPFAESESALAFMRDNWKLSLIRAAMGIEASNGYASGGQAAMLGKVEKIVQNAIRQGVYVLVDWHTERAVDQQAAAVEFFAAMARRYGGYPNVIWEPYNEPARQTWDQIKPYHEAVVDAIRGEDPDNLVVLGTPNWSQYVDVASTNPVNPTSGTANLLYTLHFYACTHTQWLRDRGDVAMANGLALFVTEFGATPSDGGSAINGDPYVCRDETNLWFDWMSTNNISGAAWKLGQCADSSCILSSHATPSGPWTDDLLTSDLGNTVVSAGKTQGGGHGLFVVDWIRR